MTIEALKLKNTYSNFSTSQHKDATRVTEVFVGVGSLTKTGINELVRRLQACEELIDTNRDLSAIELSQILFVFNIVNINIQAINFCSLSLNQDLLRNEDDQNNFFHRFKNTVERINSSGLKTKEEQLSRQVQQIAKKIQLNSISLFKPNTNDLLKSLKDELHTKDPHSFTKCKMYITFLSQPDQIKAIVKSQNDEQLKMLTEVFTSLVEIRNIQTSQQLEVIDLETKDEPRACPVFEKSTLQVVSRLILNFSTEVTLNYNLAQQRKTKKITEKQQKDVERLEPVLAQIATLSFNALSQGIGSVMSRLNANCDQKKEDEHWEGICEKYKKVQKLIYDALFKDLTFQLIARMLCQTFGVQLTMGSKIIQAIVEGATSVSKSIGLFYTLWRKYAEKLQMGDIDTFSEEYELRDLREPLNSLQRHLCWYLGHLSYNYIRINPVVEPIESKNDQLTDAQIKERNLKRALQMVLHSNLLSGGMEVRHLHTFSKDTKEKLVNYSSIMKDSNFKKAIEEHHINCDELTLHGDEDSVIGAIIYEGKDEDTDLTIQLLQKMLETKMPMVTYARIGGKDGMKMSRAAFAVMIKFSDLVEDFVALVDCVGMQANLELGDDKHKNLIALMKQQPHCDVINRRWESAARMRQWINEKKQRLVGKLEKEVMTEVRKKKEEEKKKAEEEKAKKQEEEAKIKEEEKNQAEEKASKAAEVKEEPASQETSSTLPESQEPLQIDSSLIKEDPPAEILETKEDEFDKKEEENKEEEQPEENPLTEQDKAYITEEAFKRMEKQLEEIFNKITVKALYMTRLQIPHRFKKSDPTRMKEGQLKLLKAPTIFEGKLPQQNTDWQTRLKSWKQMQTSKGTIKSLTERQTEIWNSGITSILALLQTAIEADQIQKQIEKTYIEACKRAAGLKILSELFVFEAPWNNFNDLIQWFCSSFRRNKNSVCHYLDETKGQGSHLEIQSSKYFFTILTTLVNRLKICKDETQAKTLIEALHWKFMARDHRELANLNIFQVLHKGNKEKDNILTKAWGRQVNCSFTSFQDTPLSKVVLDFFEQLFVNVAGRIVEPEHGSALKLKDSTTGVAPSLAKAKSVIDENASEQCLTMAFEVIFKEIERYIAILMKYKGADWGTFVRFRNKERKDKNDDLDEIEIDDNKLLDEVSEEEATEDKADQKEDEEDKKSEKSKKSEKIEEKPANEPKPEEVKEEAKEEQKSEDGSLPDDDDNKDSEGGEGGEAEKEEEPEKEKNELSQILIKKREADWKELSRLYNNKFLKRMLKLVELFTSIATASSHPLSMVQRVANPYSLSSLFNLLLMVSSENKILILKVIHNLIEIHLPYEVFEEAVNIQVRNEGSMSHRILNSVVSTLKFEGSQFMKFLYFYLLHIRQKMWHQHQVESEGIYAVSQTLSSILRDIRGSNSSKSGHFGEVLNNELNQALTQLETLSPEESEVVLCLLPGGDCNVLTAGDIAISSGGDYVKILGFTDSWVDAAELTKLMNDSETKAKKKLQQTLHLEFTHEKQMAIGLFYNKDQKARQDIMVLHPSSLGSVINLEKEDAIQVARNSPLMKSEVIIKMIAIMQHPDHNNNLQILKAQILKVISCQIEILGQEYINFVKREHLLGDLMQLLYQATQNKSQNAQEVIPLQWLESRIQNIRKLATEQTYSIVQTQNLQAVLMDKKELLFKAIDPETQNITRFNARLTCAINLHRVNAGQWFTCIQMSSIPAPSQGEADKQTVKSNLVFMPFNQFKEMNESVLTIFKNSDAILTNPDKDFKVQDYFNQLFELFKKDQEKSESKRMYSNVFDTVFFFVSDRDYQKCLNPPKIEPLVHESFKTVINKLPAEDKERVLLYIKDDVQLNNPSHFIPAIEAATKEMKENQKKEADEIAALINKNLTKEAEELKKNQEVSWINKKYEILKKKQIFKLVDKSQDYSSNEIKVPIIDRNFESNSAWKITINKIVEKLGKKSESKDSVDKEQKKKTDEQMTKLFHKVSSDFNENNLPQEHSKAINNLITAQRKNCFFLILKFSDLNEIMPEFLKTQESCHQIQSYLNMYFGHAVLNLLQNGHKHMYKEIKDKIKDIFVFCNNSEQFQSFTETFLVQHIFIKGDQIVELARNDKLNPGSDMVEFFSSIENSTQFLNPLMLRFITKFLMKHNPKQLIRIEGCVAFILNMHLIYVLYFQKNKELCIKMLRSCCKLISFAKSHIDSIKGQVKQIVQNFFLKTLSKSIDFQSEGNFFTHQQLLILELHLQIEQFREAANQHGLSIGKFLEESREICLVKQYMQVMRENDNFDLLKYLYHLESLSDDKKKMLNKKLETNHPAFNINTRAKIHFPYVQRVQIKPTEATKIKSMAHWGISNDPEKGIEIQTQKEFDWSAGTFYIHYPIYKQCVTAFGKNQRFCLGSSQTSDFKEPSMSMPTEDNDKDSFIPVRVTGSSEYTAALTDQGVLWETGTMSNTQVAERFKKSTLKEKVCMIKVSQNSAWIVLDNGSVHYKGSSINFHFPNDESCGNWKQFKLWEKEEDVEKITDIAVGNGFTMLKTEKNKLWAIGELFLKKLDLTSQKPVEISSKLPKGFTISRMWANNSTDKMVAFLDLVDGNGVQILHSAGESDMGLLGQGAQKQSIKFKQLLYDEKQTQFVSLSISDHAALAIDQENKLWGWGLNSSHRLGQTSIEENGINRPFALYQLNNLGLLAKQVSLGQYHSLVLFEDKKGNELLFTVGIESQDQLAHLGVKDDDSELANNTENPFRHVKAYDDRKILSILAHDSLASIVVLDGPTETQGSLYHHQLPNGKSVKGLIHFYKQGDTWHFLSEQEYASADKSQLPNLSFAIKAPIKNITERNWPDLAALAEKVIDKERLNEAEFEHNGFENTTTKQPIKGPMYFSKCIINNKEVEVCHSEQTVLNDDWFSINPIIFFRIAKPLIKNAEIPRFNLDDFYEADDKHGLDIEIIPEIDIEKNLDLIKLTQTAWDEINENSSKFEAKFKDELLKALNDVMSSILTDKKIVDINFEKEFKVGDLKIEDKGLKKLSEKAKKQQSELYWMLNKYFFKSVPYCSSLQRGIKGSCFDLLTKTKASLLSSIKSKFVDEQITSLQTGGRGSVTIKRHAANRFIESGKCDHTGEFTIFGQLFQQCQRNDRFKKENFRQNSTDDQIFDTSFAGEGSIDVGGPFRECLSNLLNELESDALPLLIKTVNNRNNHGSNRDCWILNSSSISPTHGELFNFLGCFLGFCIRTKSAINWHFPPIFWKQMIGEKVTISDLEGIDAYSYQCLKDIELNGKKLKPEDFDAVIEETFETFLSNGKKVELCEGGKEKKVNHSNYKEFIELVIKTRLSEYEKQMNWVKDGFAYVIDPSILHFLSWQDIELRACGAKDIDVEQLKKISSYNVDGEHKCIKWFWEMFDKFTQDERQKYLKFVWGRSKLPVDCSDLAYKHEIHVYDHMSPEELPQAHTCFFTVDIPIYKSLEIMTKKIKLAIELCGEIDTDYNPNNIADEDGNRGGGYGSDY